MLSTSLLQLSAELPAIRMQRRGSLYDPFESSITKRSRRYRDSVIHHETLQDVIEEERGLSTIQCALAFISTIVGAGIVSLPYALMEAGTTTGLILHLCMMCILQFAVYLYLKTKDNLGYESFGEIAFLCYGRASVFIINFVIAFGTFAVVVMYMLLFGKIFSSFFQSYRDLTGNDTFDTILKSKITYCVFVYLVLFAAVLKKNIKELAFTSILLFTGVITMVLIFFLKFLSAPTLIQSEDIKPTYTSGGLIDSISIILTSYAFIINFFPIYSSLDKRTNENGLKASTMALCFCFVIYVSFSLLAINSYGVALNPNIFENIQQEDNWQSIFIRILFLMIFMCNIPFIFLPGKEALLLMIDEYINRSMSIQMMRRIDQIQNGLLHHPNDTATQASFLLLNYRDEDDEVKAARIAYQVSNGVYYANAIGLFTLQLICSIFIDDVTVIFGFFAAISESMLNFFIPATCYLISCRIANRQPNFYLKMGCILYLFLGSGLFFGGLYHNIRKFTG